MKQIETPSGKLLIGNKDDVFALLKTPEKKHFDVIWNLAQELDHLSEKEKKFAEVLLCSGISDYSIPESKLFYVHLAHCYEVLQQNGTIFVHCFGGKGRTSLAVAALKILMDGISQSKALKFVTNECFGGPETEEQILFIKSLFLKGSK